MVVINQVAPIYVTFSVPGRYLPEIRQNQARARSRSKCASSRVRRPAPQQLPPANPDAAPAAPGRSGRRAAARGGASTLHEGGVVTFIDNAVDPTTGTIKLKGTFQNADHALWPGLFVQVTLVLSTDANGGGRACRGGAGLAGRPVRLHRQAGSHRRDADGH